MDIKEMIHIFKSHNVVTFTLTGLGETIMNTEQFEHALTELERFAEIGKTLETLAQYSRINLEAFIEDEGKPQEWELEYFNEAYDDDVTIRGYDLKKVLTEALKNVLYYKSL